ncbi:MAG: peptide MFS transporter [Myxococcales bacterium]|nr:peptide MFS transporter [Myxococcales bacterium]
MQPASVAVATDLSAVSQSTPSPIPDPERSRSRALLIACLTVALERFAFYVVFSLYTLCLIDRHHFTEAQAATHYGLFIGLAYFTPLLGGPIADCFGRWRTVAASGVLLSLSYFLFIYDSLRFWFLFLFSIGAGLFKRNITAAVGALFPDDAERDTAYSRFYLAINLGALPSGVVGAWLVKHHGYSLAFLVCGLSCLLATVLWCSARFLLSAHHRPPRRHHEALERDRLITIFVLLPVAVTFFFVCHQSGSSLTLFARDNTVPTLLGIALDPPTYQSLQAALVIGLTPMLNRIWRSRPLATHLKILLGLLLVSGSCLVMATASLLGGNTGRVSPLWLIGSYLLVSVAELCVSPVGFSLVSKLAPPRRVGLLMGLWLAAIAVGNLSAGLIGRYWTEWSHHTFFLVLSGLSVLALPLLLAQRKRLRIILGGAP